MQGKSPPVFAFFIRVGEIALQITTGTLNPSGKLKIQGAWKWIQPLRLMWRMKLYSLKATLNSL